MYRKKQKVVLFCWFILENHFGSIPNAQNSEKKKLNPEPRDLKLEAEVISQKIYSSKEWFKKKIMKMKIDFCLKIVSSAREK